MSKYGQLIEAARKPDNEKAGMKEVEMKAEPEVSLSMKVAAARRRHWAAEAKRRGVTLTATITEALSERFGEPS